MISFVRQQLNSIAVRVVLIIIAGSFLLQLAIVAVLQFPAIYRVLPETLGQEAEAIAELVWMVENVPEELEPYILSLYQSSGRRAVVQDSFPTGARDLPRIRHAFGTANTDAAARLLDRKMVFKTSGFRIFQQAFGQVDPNAVTAASVFVIATELDDQRILIVELAPYLYLASGNLPAAISTIWIFLAIGQAIALAFVIFHPIRSIERDAEQVGLAELGTPISENGPSELRRISRALNRMRERLAGLVQERDDIFAAIAHDIRTGITKIRLRTEASDIVRADEIEPDLSQMETLISDMLTYARAEHPRSVAEVINVPELLGEIVSRAPIDVDFRESDAATSFSIAGDRVALQRLFDNLIENARRYGEPPISILTTHDQTLEIRVRDNGEGLPEEQLEHIFQPFARGDSSRNRNTGGSGLGLGISRAIARAHGGDLHLENNPNGGLDAVVTLPAHLRT